MSFVLPLPIFARPSLPTRMFRIISSPSDASAAPSHARAQQQAMEDILMEEDFAADDHGAGPSRAQGVGGGRVTGPGEAIADAGKWMRCVERGGKGGKKG